MMGARPLPLSQSSRRTLNTQGMHESIRARAKTDAGLTSPLCIYKLCEAHGVLVRFVDVNMEGMYQRSATPRIFISSMRPVARRAFNCAHELGHHLFGHGSTVDQLYEERSKEDRDQPNEILANAFAAFALMPTLGLRDAFTRRNLSPGRATPEQLFAIASNFGVGYSTLINHMAYGVETIAPLRASELLKSSPRTIRASLLGAPTAAPLVVADEHWNASTLDLEVDSLVLLPKGASVDAPVLARKGTVGSLELFQALAPGIRRATVPGTQWATFIRVSRQRYVGLAKYRHLGDLGDD